MPIYQNNGAAIGVGVAIFVVVIIIIIVVAFGCNGGWFGRYSRVGAPANETNYVALNQKNKTHTEHGSSKGGEVQLAQKHSSDGPECVSQPAGDTA